MTQRWTVLALAVTWVACGAPVSTTDAGDDDAGATQDAGADAGGGGGGGGGGDAGTADGGNDAGVADGGSDAGVPDGGGADAGDLVPVSHPREFRGMWVATVLNLDLAQSVARSRDAGVAELGRIVDVSARNGLNAIVFQVRPESDAWYASAKEPWSRYLTGTQGQDPGYDPLQELITLAHARGVEVHAWMNPYRAAVTATNPVDPTHISQVLSQHAVTYGTAKVMDPSAPAVRSWVVEVVREVVRGYDVDGVHFDDYFYPYPISGTPFPDNPQYAAYTADGGTLTKLAWRRENVNALVREVSQAVAQEKPWVRFGISPFGIYRPGQPAGITGLDAYNDISCDSVLWMQQGWVDYLAPQLYWPTTQSGQQYGLLIPWWGMQAVGGRHIFSGNALYKIGTSSAWTWNEFRTQVSLDRQQAPNVAGQIWFRYQWLRDDTQGSQTVFQQDFYPTPALPPAVAALAGTMVAAPDVTVQGGMVSVSHVAPATLRGWSVYRLSLGTWEFDRLVPVTTTQFTLLAGQWAIAALDKADVESLGRVIDVP